MNSRIQNNNNITGFAKYLIEQDLITHIAIEEITTQVYNHNETLITKLIANNILGGFNLAKAISDYFHIPLIDLKNPQYQQLPLDSLQPQLIQKYQVLPITITNKQLQLAMADPTNLSVLNTIKFYTTLSIAPVVVAHDQLTQIIKKFLPTEKYISSGNGDTPIIKFIDKILNDAITKHASDIHFEPYEDCYRIRLRIDGLLHENTKTELSLGPRFSTRLKIMANLNIAEKRLPQDGRFTLKLPTNRNQDCRLSTCPTIFGEKLVIRILNPINTTLNIDNLGFNEKEQQLFRTHINMPQGLILVTGPTGSGKTITLYTALNILNQPSKNILTIEDPIEINLYGINQVEVNHKTGLNFTKALLAFLRQDPDIIMIGEIRDLETAQIAIKAAHTGHLVLATLHTNSATATLTRLLNMGISALNLATTISLIIAQRLVRKLCTYCKQPQILPKTVLAENNLEENTIPYIAYGCEHCNQGYQNRMAIFEMLPITPIIRDLIIQHCNLSDIEKQMHMLDIPTLRTSALNKVKSGIVSLEEVNRVIT